MPSHRFVALKCISVLEKARPPPAREAPVPPQQLLTERRVAAAQDKRQQLLNELRLMCDGSTAGVRGVVAYIGTYFVPEHNTARSQSPNRARVTCDRLPRPAPR